MKFGVLEGNGIGPEIMQATKMVVEATGLPVEWVDIPIADTAIEKYGPDSYPHQTLPPIYSV